MTLKKKRTIYKIGALSLARKIGYCRELDELIKAGATGTLEEFAAKIDITESLLSDLLVYMIEELHCPISYSQTRKTYFYDREGELRIGFYPHED